MSQITLLTGENAFAIREALDAIRSEFDGQAEIVEGSELELRQLPELLMGSTLFAERRLVIIKDLSQNKALWEKLPEWLPRVADEIRLVFVDVKPDKRTAAYKELKKIGAVQEFPVWTERDQAKAQAWVADRAAAAGTVLDKKIVRRIVDRAGTDQWALAQALEKVMLLDEPTEAMVDDIIEAQPSENVFTLFELALEGRTERLQSALRTLELSEDPHKLFALLSSQAVQLAAVAQAGEGDDPIKDVGIHPFVASKLTRPAKRLGKKGATALLSSFAAADADMKSSRGEPWLIIEKTLLGIK